METLFMALVLSALFGLFVFVAAMLTQPERGTAPKYPWEQ